MKLYIICFFFLFRVYIDWSVSPLEVIDDIHSNGITELLEEARDQSHAYPTLAMYANKLWSTVCYCVLHKLY